MQNRSFSSVKVFYPRFEREALLALLRQRVTELRGKLPVERIVLFGSYAKGRQTVASDIDLLVIYTGQPRADAYALVKRALNIRHLEPHVYAEEEYEAVRTTVERMVHDGIPVVPAEC